MGLLFGGDPAEVPLRRKVLRALVYAAMKARASAQITPRGRRVTCTPSTRRVLEVDFAHRP